MFDADRTLGWKTTPSGRPNQSGVEAPRHSRSISLKRLKRRALPSSERSRRNRLRPRTQIIDAAMIRIAITQAAFDAIAATLPLGGVSYENARQRAG